MPLTLVIASANPGKSVELRELLCAELGADVVILDRPLEVPEIEETGTTLEENARLKAVTVAASTGLPAIADDTGLEVTALDGAPGVYSARYAGEGCSDADNVAKLLAALEAVPDRSARFRTVCVVAFPGGRQLIAEGSVSGRIAEHPSGSMGFGYDPIFRPDLDPDRSFAEFTNTEKHDLSHRGAAIREIAKLLRTLTESAGS